MRAAFWFAALLAAGSGLAQTLGNQVALAHFASTLRPSAQTEQLRPKILTGRPAPTLRVDHWFNAAHDPVTKDRAVLIDFWSVNCAPCVANLPKVVAIAQRFKSKPFTVITIHPDEVGVKEAGIAGNSIWRAKPAEQVLPSFLAIRNIALPVGIDDRHFIATAYALDAIPTYFLIDRRGIVRFESHDLPTEAEMAAVLAE
jgi:thiol-disulfide isomerase/thioredoxin